MHHRMEMDGKYTCNIKRLFTSFRLSHRSVFVLPDFMLMVLSMKLVIYNCLSFFCFRRLRCPRTTIHLNLFISFILRAFASLLKENLFVGGVGLAKDVKIGDNGAIDFIQEGLVSILYLTIN